MVVCLSASPVADLSVPCLLPPDSRDPDLEKQIDGLFVAQSTPPINQVTSGFALLIKGKRIGVKNTKPSWPGVNKDNAAVRLYMRLYVPPCTHSFLCLGMNA